MRCEVVRVYNNNVILVKEGDRESVLVSKGIGFGKKRGDIIENPTNIEKIFLEAPSDDITPPRSFSDRLQQQIEEITNEILEMAEPILGLLSRNIEKALKEHIEFALERLHMGMQVDNPFIDEIKSLYRKEYQIAQIAREMIAEKLNIDIGEGEQAFIALYLYSARTNKSVRETINTTKIYKACIKIIEEEFECTFNLRLNVTKQFLNNLKEAVKQANKQAAIQMPLQEYVRRHMKKSYIAAETIAKYLLEEIEITLTSDMIAYLAIDIERLVCYIKK